MTDTAELEAAPAAVEIPGLADARIVDLLTALCQGEARLVVVGAAVTAVRRALEARATDYLETEGVAPTMRATDLGRAVLSDPKPKVVVRDSAAFGEYVAATWPTEATAVYTVRVPVHKLTDEQVELLESLPDVTRTIEVNSAWQAPFLKSCQVVDTTDSPEGALGRVVLSAQGDVVDGLTEQPAGKRTLSVTLDPKAKARALEEVQQVALGIFGPLLSAEAPAIEGTVVLEADPGELEAEGVPDEPRMVAARPDGSIDHGSPWDGMTMGQLRDELRFLELPVGGTKQQLIARLDTAAATAVAS